jgi:hypothetical protein
MQLVAEGRYEMKISCKVHRRNLATVVGIRWKWPESYQPVTKSRHRWFFTVSDFFVRAKRQKIFSGKSFFSKKWFRWKYFTIENSFRRNNRALMLFYFFFFFCEDQKCWQKIFWVNFISPILYLIHKITNCLEEVDRQITN